MKVSRTLNESFLPFNLPDKTDHKVLRKSENLLSKPISEENTYGIRELKHLRNKNPFRVIIDHINIDHRPHPINLIGQLKVGEFCFT